MNQPLVLTASLRGISFASCESLPMRDKRSFVQSINHLHSSLRVSVRDTVAFFELFLTLYPDRLLLLERGGRTVYFGDIGPDSSVIRSYLTKRGATCPPNLNVAEYMLEAIGAGVTARIGSRDWGDLWIESSEFAETKREIIRLKEEGLKHNPTDQAERATACEFIVPSETRTSFC